MVTLLSTHAERVTRFAAKRRAILRLLRDEIYTTREVVQVLLGIAPTPAKLTLAAMVRDGLLRMDRVECPNGWRPFLWGITAEGQAMAFDPECEKPNDRVFEPGRVGLSVVNHTIAIQLARIHAERAGWTEWHAGDRLAKWEKDQGRPDAIALTDTGKRVAVELELTIKTTKRYESILFDRLRQIKCGHFEQVIWIAEYDDRAARLAAIVKGISQFTREHAGQRQLVRIDPTIHHPRLAFTSLTAWADPTVPKGWSHGHSERPSTP